MDDLPDGREHESDLPEVTTVPLLDLMSSRDPALVESIQRLLAEVRRPHESIASWGNFVG
jgi:hypothetical protein